MTRQLFYIPVFALTLFFMAGCGNNPNKKSTSQETAAGQSTPLEVDELLTHAETLSGEIVTIEGICTHICKHGGRKIFLMGSDEKHTVRIEAGERIGAFKPECVNNMVRVTGTVSETRIDEAYLADWERRVQGQRDERHGQGEAGCSAEQKARGETVAANATKRIAAFRARIADRKAKDGKAYLSFYHIEGESYDVLH